MLSVKKLKTIALIKVYVMIWVILLQPFSAPSVWSESPVTTDSGALKTARDELSLAQQNYEKAVKDGQLDSEQIGELFEHLKIKQNQYESLTGQSLKTDENEVSAPGSDPDLLERIRVATATTEILDGLKEAGSNVLTNPLATDKMSLVESIAWNIGKVMIPTLGAMTAAAFLGPFLPVWGVVAGTIALGAGLGGGMSYAYDWRSNQFRSDESKKSRELMGRDAVIAAVREGIMAPFNMMLPGLFKPIGHLTGKLVFTTAAKTAGVVFAGSTLGNVGGGIARNIYNNQVFDYRKRKEEIRQRLAALQGHNSLTDAEKVEVAQLLAAQETLEKDSYNMKKFVSETKKGAVTSIISGFLGGAAAKVAARSNLAGRVSMAIFKDVKQAGMVANTVVNLPFAYGSGFASSELGKSELKSELAQMRSMLARAPADSPYEAFYQAKIDNLEAKIAGTDSKKAGMSAMLTSFAINSAMLSFTAVKTRLWDLPRATRTEINRRYQDQNPEWKKYNEIKGKMSGLKAPVKKEFPARKDYLEAKSRYQKDYSALKAQLKTQEKLAKASDNQLFNQASKEKITEDYMRELRSERTLTLARFFGEKEYLAATVKMMHKKGVPGTEAELYKLARRDLQATYEAKYLANKKTLDSMNETLLKGGKATNVLSPSAYREAYIKMKVGRLRHQGMTESQVLEQMDDVIAAADDITLQKFGGNWLSMAKWELRANTLKKVGYDNDGSRTDMDDLTGVLNKVPKQFQDKFIAHYRANLQKQVKNWTLVPLMKKLNYNGESEYLNAFVNKYTQTVANKAYSATVDQAVKDGFDGAVNGAGGLAGQVKDDVQGEVNWQD